MLFMKVYQWFYWNSNLQFWEKSQPVPGAPKQSCSVLQNFSWRPSWFVHPAFGFSSITLVPLKQLIWNWHTRSGSIMGWQSSPRKKNLKINWSESNSLIYFYIDLIKMEKFTGPNKVLLVLIVRTAKFDFRLYHFFRSWELCYCLF